MNRTITALLCLAAVCTSGGVLLWALATPGIWVLLSMAAACGLILAAFSAQRRQHLTDKQTYEADLQAAQLELHQALAAQREQNHKEIERFRSDLAHGLRIPIAIVQGYAELLVEDKVPDPAMQKDYLNKIVQRSQYMSTLLVKQFSVIDLVDSSAVNFGVIDLIQLIQQIADDMQNIARNQDVHIQVVSMRQSLLVEADAHLLNRIFFNLLENAIKYMGRGGVVTVRATELDCTVAITVKDDGMGLPAEETAHIFEQDYRGSNRTGSSGNGHGLYLVHHIVQLHGGTVTAESDTGRGMAIHITLPLRQSAARQAVYTLC